MKNLKKIPIVRSHTVNIFNEKILTTVTKSTKRRQINVALQTLLSR